MKKDENYQLRCVQPIIFQKFHFAFIFSSLVVLTFNLFTGMIAGILTTYLLVNLNIFKGGFPQSVIIIVVYSEMTKYSCR